MTRHIKRPLPPHLQTVDAPSTWLEKWPDGFVTVIDGSSMHPTLRHGDFVFCTPGRIAGSNAPVVVEFTDGGGWMVGRYVEDEAGAWLQKENPNDSSYPRVFLGDPARDFAIKGTVQRFMRSIGR